MSQPWPSPESVPPPRKFDNTSAGQQYPRPVSVPPLLPGKSRQYPFIEVTEDPGGQKYSKSRWNALREEDCVWQINLGPLWQSKMGPLLGTR